MARFVRHRVTGKVNNSTNNYDFWFLAPPDGYAGINTACGVTQISDTDVGNYMPLCKVEELLKSAAAVRRKLLLTKANAPSKYKTVVVATEKAAGFETDVVGKAVGDGYAVARVVESLDATYY